MKFLNKSYVGNVIKSISKGVLSTTPNINKSVSNNKEVIAKHFKKIKTTTQSDISSSKSYLYQSGKKLMQNSINDLKSGNIYNQRRLQKATKEAMSEMGVNADIDFNKQVQVDSDEDNYIDGENIVNSKKNTTVIVNTLDNESTISTISNVSSTIVDNENKAFSVISNSINSILKFHNENTIEFYNNTSENFSRLNEQIEKTSKMIEQIANIETAGIQSDNEYSKFLNFLDEGKSMSIDYYFNKAMESIRGKTNNKSNSFKAHFNKVILSPISALTVFAFKTVNSKILSSLKNEISDVITAIPGAIQLKFAKMKKSNSFLTRMIGDIFGVNLNKQSIDLSDYKKDAVKFDGITRRAIVNVIPSLLSKILSATSDNPLHKDLVYDYNKGSFTNKKQIMHEANNALKDGISYNDDLKKFKEKLMSEYYNAYGTKNKNASNQIQSLLENMVTNSAVPGMGDINQITRNKSMQKILQSTYKNLSPAEKARIIQSINEIDTKESFLNKNESYHSAIDTDDLSIRSKVKEKEKPFREQVASYIGKKHPLYKIIKGKDRITDAENPFSKINPLYWGVEGIRFVNKGISALLFGGEHRSLKEVFSSWMNKLNIKLFGKDKAEDNGIVKNIQENLIQPFKDTFMKDKKIVKKWWTDNVTVPLKGTMKPFFSEFKHIVGLDKDKKDKDKKNFLMKIVDNSVTQPISDAVKDDIIKPLKNSFRKLTNAITNVLVKGIHGIVGSFKGLSDRLRVKQAKRLGISVEEYNAKLKSKNKTQLIQTNKEDNDMTSLIPSTGTGLVPLSKSFEGAKFNKAIDNSPKYVEKISNVVVPGNKTLALAIKENVGDKLDEMKTSIISTIDSRNLLPEKSASADSTTIVKKIDVMNENLSDMPEIKKDLGSLLSKYLKVNHVSLKNDKGTTFKEKFEKIKEFLKVSFKKPEDIEKKANEIESNNNDSKKNKNVLALLNPMNMLKGGKKFVGDLLSGTARLGKSFLHLGGTIGGILLKGIGESLKFAGKEFIKFNEEVLPELTDSVISSLEPISKSIGSIISKTSQGIRNKVSGAYEKIREFTSNFSSNIGKMKDNFVGKRKEYVNAVLSGGYIDGIKTKIKVKTVKNENSNYEKMKKKFDEEDRENKKEKEKLLYSANSNKDRISQRIKDRMKRIKKALKSIFNDLKDKFVGAFKNLGIVKHVKSGFNSAKSLIKNSSIGKKIGSSSIGRAWKKTFGKSMDAIDIASATPVYVVGGSLDGMGSGSSSGNLLEDGISDVKDLVSGEGKEGSLLGKFKNSKFANKIKGSKTFNKITGSKTFGKLAKLGGKASGKLGKFAKFGGKMLGKVALPLAIATSVFDAVGGWNEAGGIFGSGKDASFGQKLSGGIGGIVNGLTFGILGTDTVAKGVYGIGSAIGGLGKAVFNATPFGWLYNGLTSGKNSEENVTKMSKMYGMGRMTASPVAALNELNFNNMNADEKVKQYRDFKANQERSEKLLVSRMTAKEKEEYLSNKSFNVFQTINNEQSGGKFMRILSSYAMSNGVDKSFKKLKDQTNKNDGSSSGSNGNNNEGSNGYGSSSSTDASTGSLNLGSYSGDAGSQIAQYKARGGKVGGGTVGGSIPKFRGLFKKYSSKYNVDPALMEALAMQESGGNVNSFNGYGAGLMQIENTLGSEFRKYGETMADSKIRGSWTLQDRFDPEKNISFGIYRFAQNLQHYKGDYIKSLQAYNYSMFSLDPLIKKFGDDWINHRKEVAYYNGVYKRTGRTNYGDPQYIEHVLKYYNGSLNGQIAEAKKAATKTTTSVSKKRKNLASSAATRSVLSKSMTSSGRDINHTLRTINNSSSRRVNQVTLLANMNNTLNSIANNTKISAQNNPNINIVTNKDKTNVYNGKTNKNSNNQKINANKRLAMGV